VKNKCSEVEYFFFNSTQVRVKVPHFNYTQQSRKE